MTITSSFQSFTVSALHVSVAGRSAAAASTTTAAPAAAGTDTVSLSTAAATAPSTSENDAATPGNTPAVSQPSSLLFATLDADRDGSVTREEFTSGALALLGKRGDHPRAHGNGDGENGRRARGVPGLERRLAKAFGRVDANDDGSLEQFEMSAALSGGADPTTDVPLPPASPETTQVGVSASFVSVTYVSVAIQRYTSLQTIEPSSSSSSATDPSGDNGVTDATPSAA